MTFISIIIPFNKGKRFLKDCLESLKYQNLEDYEIILILNGVTEDLIDIFNEYQNLQIKKEIYEEELGVAKARNEGIKIATGDYLYFIDSDDYIYKDGLKKLITIAKETNKDIISGSKISTHYIRERFEEEPKINKLVKQRKLSDEEFALRLIVGKEFKTIEFLSVLNILIKADIIRKNNIQFNESKRYTSDYEFILNVINNSNTFKGTEEAIYAKRIRDDFIHTPALSQEVSKDSNLSNLEGDIFLIFTKTYEESLKTIDNFSDKTKSKLLRSVIIEYFLDYYKIRFSFQFRSNRNSQWRTIYLDEMAEIAKTFYDIPMSRSIKREINTLIKKDKKALRRHLNFRLAKKKIKTFLNDPWRIKQTIYLNIYNKKPIKENQIIFESFRGDFYSDSPKYLYEYLYNNYKDDFEFVWVINNNNTKIPGNPKTVKRFSINFYKELARSKYWVINGRQALRLLKRPEQVIVSTWHGTPLKRLGLDIGDVHGGTPKIKKEYVQNAREWKYLVSPNNYTTNILKSAFAYEGEILEVGYPRNDILYNATEEKVASIKDNLNIPKDKKIILYAPTWRDDESYDRGQYKFSLKLELDKLKESISDEYIVLIRTHYFIADRLDLSEYDGFAFDVSRYDDIAELYLISDILITDYSSVFFDFANLKRPILFYTYDLEKYENVLRGFYIDIHKEVPGPLVFNTEEVIDKIKNLDQLKEEYEERYETFYNRFCSVDNGTASKQIVEKVWKK